MRMSLKPLLLPLAAAATLGLVPAGNAGAAAVIGETITFDEPAISLGDFITDQYASLGVLFGGTPAGTVKNGTATWFGNTFPTDGNIVHFDQQSVDVLIDFTPGLSFLSFEYRRPSQSRDITISLFNDGSPVFSDTVTAIDDWTTFSFSGTVDQLGLVSDRKFVFDNLAFTPVPLPPAAALAALPLAAVLRRRRARA